MGSTAAIRRKQLEYSQDERGLKLSLPWFVKKIENQLLILKRLKEKRPQKKDVFEPVEATLKECVHKLGMVEGTTEEQRGTIMGLEGTAGRVYFECLSKIIPLDYRFSGRSRRPAKDGFNAMLNYSYGVLYSRVERALILAGLDPFVGFLHTDNYNKRSLVFDLIEPFRYIADKSTILFFTGRRVKKNFFRKVPGGIELAPDGRAALIANLNDRLDKTVKYPVKRTQTGKLQKFRRIKLGTTIQYEAHSTANALLGKENLPKIVESDELLGIEKSES